MLAREEITRIFDASRSSSSGGGGGMSRPPANAAADSKLQLIISGDELDGNSQSQTDMTSLAEADLTGR